MSPIAYTAAIIAVAVVLFVWNRLPVVVVAMATALALWATGVLTLGQALGGFGDPAVIFIASLFVVSSGLEMTGVTAWAGQLLIRGAGEESRTRLLLLTMSLVALLTALISVNGAVAALLPVVVVIAVRLKRNSSQLLMPLVFAAHAGSMLALTGTPVNVLVSEAGSDAGVGGFGFFEFALVGVPLLAGTMAIIVLFGKRLLPERNGATMPADFSRHAKTLVEQYGLASGIYQMRVRASSPYVGAPPSAIDLAAYPGLQLVAVQEGETAGPLRRPVIAEGDHLLLRGDAEAAAAFAAEMHLAFREDDGGRTGRGDAVQPPLGPRRGRDPAALGPHRPDRLSGHGHRKRRPDHPCRAARRRGDRRRQRGKGCRRNRAAGRRHHAAAGNLEGARRSSRRSRRPGRQFARTGASPGRADGAGRTPGRRHPGRDGPAARHRLRPARRGRPAGRRRDHPVGDHDRRAVLPRHRLDDGDPRRRDDAAVDRDGRDRAPQS